MRTVRIPLTTPMEVGLRNRARRNDRTPWLELAVILRKALAESGDLEPTEADIRAFKKATGL